MTMTRKQQSADKIGGITEIISQYLTGPRFRHRVEAIVEAFSTMREDLDKERKTIMGNGLNAKSRLCA